MTRSELKRLSLLRLKEAQALIAKKCYYGGYYLSGYAIECALKACIAKKMRRNEFPDLKTVQDSYTHNLERLIGVAGLKTNLSSIIKADSSFDANWATAKDWSEEARYKFYKQRDAEDLYKAISDPKKGVLQWITNYW